MSSVLFFLKERPTQKIVRTTMIIPNTAATATRTYTHTCSEPSSGSTVPPIKLAVVRLVSKRVVKGLLDSAVGGGGDVRVGLPAQSRTCSVKMSSFVHDQR